MVLYSMHSGEIKIEHQCSAATTTKTHKEINVIRFTLCELQWHRLKSDMKYFIRRLIGG